MRVAAVAAPLCDAAACPGTVRRKAGYPKLNTPLPCVDVALEDSAAHVVAHAQTADDGAFQFDSPPSGSYRPRFSAWYHPPAYGAFETLDPTAERARLYQIDFGPDEKGGRKFWPDTTDSPPEPPEPQQAVPSLSAGAQEGFPSTERYGCAFCGQCRVGRAAHYSGAEIHSGRLHFGGAADLHVVHFEPARRDGRPVCAMIVDQPFTFSVERGR